MPGKRTLAVTPPRGQSAEDLARVLTGRGEGWRIEIWSTPSGRSGPELAAVVSDGARAVVAGDLGRATRLAITPSAGSAGTLAISGLSEKS